VATVGTILIVQLRFYVQVYSSTAVLLKECHPRGVCKIVYVGG